MRVACRAIAVGLCVAAGPSVALSHDKHSDTGTRDFDKLKKLVGEWVNNDDDPGNDAVVVLTFRLTAGGHAVVETSAPPGEDERVTVYHLDNGDLMLTHYCSLGNQPRMRARHDSAAENVIRFDFAGGFNLRADRDPHMHQLVITLTDEDRFTAQWTVFDRGLSAGGAEG